jgi:AAA family ATP:ADP antiporter
MKILQLLKSNDPRYKGHLWYFLLGYFFVLFNYPLVRAASTTMFFEEFGAKSTPGAWILTVMALTCAIFAFNKLHSTRTVQLVLLIVSLLSTLFFSLATTGFVFGIKYSSYLCFIWKEIYIVLQIHLMLAYANNFFRKEDFKAIIGPVGAVGSIGGILGGLLTTWISKNYGTNAVSIFSLAFVLLPAIIFLRTPEIRNEGQATSSSPMQSLDTTDIKNYVFHVALIVLVSQFIINIADFKFNMAFEAAILESSQRTAYLGSVYTWTNFVSLLLQFLVLPLILPRISEKSLHLFIPAGYLTLLVGIIFTTESTLMPVAIFYTYLKASDYSLFSAGKELLYQVLKPEQKYGAKYLTDMLVYRYAKALIAVVLIYLQSSFMLNIMMAGFLLIWLFLVFRIFVIHRRIFN